MSAESRSTNEKDELVSQTQLADVVKGLHKRLRGQLKAAIESDESVTGGLDAEEAAWNRVWKEHCENVEELGKYAHAMHGLARNVWQDRGQSRLTWCVQTCREYFEAETGLFQLLRKQYRRRHDGKTLDSGAEMAGQEWEHQMSCLSPPCTCEVHSSWFSHRAIPLGIRMLDVGSCYNPFSQFEGLCPVAIDLCPADQSTLQCDFTGVAVTQTEDCVGHLASLSSPVTTLPGQAFHCVTFCLLLSYLPSARQRWLCCVKAYQLLVPYGLFLITTPDSSHVGRHAQLMKAWKASIEEIGFKRWRYEKLEHLHCMAFCRLPGDRCRAKWHGKVLGEETESKKSKSVTVNTTESASPGDESLVYGELPIPQDTSGAGSDSDSDTDMYSLTPRTENEDKEIANVFEELPQFLDD